jgi:predicted enzyme related to lactoylglutathione lyase
MGAPVIHFEIMGGKGNELDTFYRDLFGWNINSNNPMKYGIVETGGAAGGINGGVGPGNDGSKRVSVYALVEGLQEALDRAERLGGKTVLPPTEVPGGPKLAMFADPAGNITGVMEKRAG